MRQSSYRYQLRPCSPLLKGLPMCQTSPECPNIPIIQETIAVKITQRPYQVFGKFLRCHANTSVYEVTVRVSRVPYVVRILIPVITSWPMPSLSGIALILIFKCSAPCKTCLSVREVSRSFSNASFAFEISSRRKISLAELVNDEYPYTNIV